MLWQIWPTVHPRRRGEHAQRFIPADACRGSSPQARGTRRNTYLNLNRRRFIPAGAGNTGVLRAFPDAQSVHPRRRGEHAHPLSDLGPDRGSSPQARGTRAIQPLRVHKQRFIPAGAGNTWARAHALRRFSVHPRRRGEHMQTVRLCWSAGGSSPQARGTRIRVGIHGDHKRFIPAGAGNTHSTCTR